MGVFEYDSTTWAATGVNIGSMCIYLANFIFIVLQFRKSRYTADIKQRNAIVLKFFVCICSSFLLRLGYSLAGPHCIRFPLPLYGVLQYFPGIILSTASLFFMDYLLSSLNSDFGLSKGRGILSYRIVIRIFLAHKFPSYSLFMHFTCSGAIMPSPSSTPCICAKT